MIVGVQFPLYGPVINASIPSYPPSHAAFLAATGLTLSAFYDCQVASGNLVDSVNARNLTAVSTPRYRYVNLGHQGIYCDSIADGFSAAVNDPVLNSAIIGAVANFPGSFATLDSVIGRQSDTTFPCFCIYRNNTVTYPQFLVRDAAAASASLQDTTVDVIAGGRPLLFLGQLDRNANLARMVVCDTNKVIVNASASIAAHVTFTGGTNPKFAIGAGNFTSGGVAVNMAFYAEGVQCQGTTKLLDIAYRLGYGR